MCGTGGNSTDWLDDKIPQQSGKCWLKHSYWFSPPECELFSNKKGSRWFRVAFEPKKLYVDMVHYKYSSYFLKKVRALAWVSLQKSGYFQDLSFVLQFLLNSLSIASEPLKGLTKHVFIWQVLPLFFPMGFLVFTPAFFTPERNSS